MWQLLCSFFYWVRSYFIKKEEEEVPHFQVTPYTRRRDQAITWLLCCKHIKFNKDVAFIIAKMIYTMFDFTQPIYDQRGASYYLRWKRTQGGFDYLVWWSNGSDPFSFACPICLMPCIGISQNYSNNYCQVHGHFFIRQCLITPETFEEDFGYDKFIVYPPIP